MIITFAIVPGEGGWTSTSHAASAVICARAISVTWVVGTGHFP